MPSIEEYQRVFAKQAAIDILKVKLYGDNVPDAVKKIQAKHGDDAAAEYCYVNKIKL